MAVHQSVNCYSGGGSRLRVTDYLTSLTGPPAAWQLLGCCLTGVWLFYQQPQYNIAQPTAPRQPRHKSLDTVGQFTMPLK